MEDLCGNLLVIEKTLNSATFVAHELWKGQLIVIFLITIGQVNVAAGVVTMSQ